MYILHTVYAAHLVRHIGKVVKQNNVTTVANYGNASIYSSCTDEETVKFISFTPLSWYIPQTKTFEFNSMHYLPYQYIYRCTYI